MKNRKAQVQRETKETNVRIKLNIDGSGDFKIDTGIPFLDHMLSLFSKHGLFDLSVAAEGDLEVDLHHTNEDIGISIGKAFNKALGEKKKIYRFGYFCVPMDEALVRISIDLSGRPSFHIKSEVNENILTGPSYNFDYAKHFLNSLFTDLGANVNIKILEGEEFHHVLESLFKCLGKTLDQATSIDGRIEGIPSTKGEL